MAKLGKRYVKEVRDIIGRFPKWPIMANLTLGDIGVFNGRAGEFEARTSLDDLGITLTPTPGNTAADEHFSSGQGVSFKFSAQQNGMGEASFKFRKSTLFTAQSYKLIKSSLPIGLLEEKLIPAIKDASIKWDKNWSIITSIYSADSFTLLISASKNANITIASVVPIAEPAFNIANPNIGLTASVQNDMHYQTSIAESNVDPFYEIHKVAFPLLGLSNIYIKQYG